MWLRFRQVVGVLSPTDLTAIRNTPLVLFVTAAAARPTLLSASPRMGSMFGRTSSFFGWIQAMRRRHGYSRQRGASLEAPES